MDINSAGVEGPYTPPPFCSRVSCIYFSFKEISSLLPLQNLCAVASAASEEEYRKAKMRPSFSCLGLRLGNKHYPIFQNSMC